MGKYEEKRGTAVPHFMEVSDEMREYYGLSSPLAGLESLGARQDFSE